MRLTHQKLSQIIYFL